MLTRFRCRRFLLGKPIFYQDRNGEVRHTASLDQTYLLSRHDSEGDVHTPLIPTSVLFPRHETPSRVPAQSAMNERSLISMVVGCWLLV